MIDKQHNAGGSVNPTTNTWFLISDSVSTDMGTRHPDLIWRDLLLFCGWQLASLFVLWWLLLCLALWQMSRWKEETLQLENGSVYNTFELLVLIIYLNTLFCEEWCRMMLWSSAHSLHIQIVWVWVFGQWRTRDVYHVKLSRPMLKFRITLQPGG